MLQSCSLAEPLPVQQRYLAEPSKLPNLKPRSPKKPPEYRPARLNHLAELWNAGPFAFAQSCGLEEASAPRGTQRPALLAQIQSTHDITQA